MISASQIKAARGLLEWKQTDLAQASGVSHTAVACLEQNKGKPRGRTMQAIITALEQAGIEFTPEPGVRLRRDKFECQIFEGHESVYQLWADIELALGQTGGAYYISGINETDWLKRYTKEEIAQALKRQRDRNIFNRLLICEGDNTVLIGPETYRAIPKMLFQQTPHLVYADRFAIINWGPPQTVVLTRSKPIAETFRKQFEFNWQHGHKLNTKNLCIVDLGMKFEIKEKL